jgi:hypothetical protein
MAEKPTRLKLPSPDARVARSPFEGRPAGFLDVGGVAASGILTLVGEPAAGDVVVLDAKTYTFEGVAAEEILTFGANASDLETVTIDGKVYTFDDTTLDNIDGHVLIGALATDSLDNLIAAITLGAGSGTLYAAATTLHPTVSVAAGAGDTMDAIAKAKGTAGNSIAVLSGVTGGWGASPMSGGLSLTNVNGNVFIGDSGPDGAIANLVAAIVLGAGSGTAYAAAMTLHPTITAAEGALITMDATAKDQGVAGNALVSTTDISAATWAPAATLGGGVDPGDAVAFVPIVQWGKMRIRLQVTGADGTLGVEFCRPARNRVPSTGLAFIYGEDQPAVDASAFADGVELSLEITATEHQGENWLKLTLSPTDDGAVLDFLDISGELLGLYH